MHRSKNQFFKQTVSSFWLIACLQIQADSSLNLSINKHQNTFETAAMKIWDWAEVGYQEFKSSELLKEELKANGFTIQSRVAEIPTAFIAEYSNGGPVVGILGEYDALPGLMQTASPFKEIRDDVDAGHACGHHLFGAASAWAAVAIKEWLVRTKTKGTIRFYGTPAEEGGSGKVYMVRAGLFDDVDVCMDWHPSDEVEAATQSSKALVDFRLRFFGDASHASGDPWNGNSAVDAMELYTTGLNYYREHVRPTARIHYDIEKAGDVVNVVPDFAQIWTRLRENDKENVNILYERAKKIAEAASMMANVDYEMELISGIYEIIPNRFGAGIIQKNIESLGEIKYTEDEINYANTILKETGKELKGIDSKIRPIRPTLPAQGGSTDVGDVSQVVPVVRMRATAAAKDGPWHSWAVVACTGMSIGHKGMIYASKALAMTMLDLYKNPKLIDGVKKEFIARKGDRVYVPQIPPGPPKLVD